MSLSKVTSRFCVWQRRASVAQGFGHRRWRRHASLKATPLRSDVPLSLEKLVSVANRGVDPFEALYTKDGYCEISELRQFRRLLQDIRSFDACLSVESGFNAEAACSHLFSARQWMRALDSALMTHCLHIQSRVSAFEGKAFYTIGPCGEESMAAVGLVLDASDSMALHYRHLSAQIARLFTVSDPFVTDGSVDMSIVPKLDVATVSEILINRARGYCVSKSDPVSRGKHCLLGGGPNDYVVTSTLASQMTPALGRALGAPMAQRLLKHRPTHSKPISFVSVGDGSTNNSHFLSALNFAEYASFRGRNLKCPLLVCVSNNRMCISLKDEFRWLSAHLNRYAANGLIKVVRCNDGSDMIDTWKKMKDAHSYVSKRQKPCILVIDGITRQFGHAASDRQSAYLSEAEIEAMAQSNVVLKLMHATCDKLQLLTYAEFYERLLAVANLTKCAFEEVATLEQKWGDDSLTAERTQLVASNSQPLLAMADPSTAEDVSQRLRSVPSSAQKRRYVMRKLMTAAIEECMLQFPECVYIGEDVRHGGYYLVTDTLCDAGSALRSRVVDFPPDETSLIGCGQGFSQSGLLPIVEIPYAKYLDCGFDMFTEAAITNWLCGDRRKNGAMLLRIQGFGDGVFGGNFHTHNAVHLVPGLDVVCYSNGADYVRGFRYCMRQVRGGRLVATVDCTKLLNVRSDAHSLPAAGHYLAFDDVVVYPKDAAGVVLTDNCDMIAVGADYRSHLQFEADSVPSVLLVTYGVGVGVCKQVQRALSEEANVCIVDTPYLSRVPNKLKKFLAAVSQQTAGGCSLVFADMCKPNGAPLNAFATELHSEGHLDAFNWRLVAAQPTYNPLGRELTFLCKEDVLAAICSHKCSKASKLNMVV